MIVFRGVTTHAILKLPMEMVEAFGSTARSQTTEGIRNRRNIYNNIEEGRYSAAYATKLTDSHSKIEAHYLMPSNIGLRMLKFIRRPKHIILFDYADAAARPGNSLVSSGCCC